MDAFDAPKQLQVLPTTRAAYSDRAAWLMSEMSELAYLLFEGENRFQNILTALDGIAISAGRKGGEETFKQIKALGEDLKCHIDRQMSLAAPGRLPEPSGLRDLKFALSRADFEFVRAFNEGGTQAFLAKRGLDKTAVLTFRGTETGSAKDVKTNLNARFYRGEGGIKVHSGFLAAYNQVRTQIRNAIDELPDDFALYITGHSLGGALAVVATKDLERDSLAACYTFGSPRVGDEEFGEAIRAPIYRVVNAADYVPRLPLTVIPDIIAFLVSPFGESCEEWIRRNFCGYLHQGDMRYLTACDDDLTALKVIHNLSMYKRAVRLVRRVISKGPAITKADHRIKEYRRKLKFYAKRRAQ